MARDLTLLILERASEEEERKRDKERPNIGARYFTINRLAQKNRLREVLPGLREFCYKKVNYFNAPQQDIIMFAVIISPRGE